MAANGKGDKKADHVTITVDTFIKVIQWICSLKTILKLRQQSFLNNTEEFCSF